MFNKTLGVNGTGIRKNYTVLTTPHPIDHSLTLHNDDLIVPSISVNNETTFEEDEISISKFSDDADTNTFNKTLEQHNITQRKEVNKFFKYNIFSLYNYFANIIIIYKINNLNVIFKN